MFSPLEFIASITQHIPEPYFQLTRMYGWYLNRMRGDRKKQEEKKNQRAPPRAAPDDQAPEIVPYDDDWPGYDEPVFYF